MKINPLGASEEKILELKRQGFKYDKRTVRQMIAAFEKKEGALEESIAAFERESEIALPDDYRRFLLDHDGGVPENLAFEIPDENNDSVLKELYGLDTPLVTSSLSYNSILFDGRIPPGFLIIGADVFGNRILLSISSSNYGKIFFWDHEREGEPQNKYLIAQSFTDFLNSLKALKNE